jgi:lauroyl/myristoyl acyltransferase
MPPSGDASTRRPIPTTTIPIRRNKVSRFLLACLSALTTVLPVSVGYAIANGLARVHLWFFPARRHAALVNLATVLPGSSRRERMRVVRDMMASYNCMLYEFFRLPRLERGELLGNVEVVGHEHVVAALERGHGVIITSCHLGNWELGAVVLAHLGHTMHAVAGVQLGRWLAPAVRDAKSELAVHTIRPEDGYRKLWRALSRNDLLALMVDGDIFGQGAALEFFGREVRWPAGPGVLSKRTGAPVVSGYVQRLGKGRFRVAFEPMLDPDAFTDEHALNAAIAQITERQIRDNIEQWCIFRPFWDEAADPVSTAAASEREIAA